MTRFAILLLGLVAGAAASNADLEANPIRKIVTLLQDMQAEITEEGKKEQELYDKYMCYCETSTGDLEKSAASATAKISELSAKVEEETAEKTQLDQELAEHKSDREGAQKELAEAAAIREKEAAAFSEEDATAQTNLDALNGALPALEKGMGAAALVQLPGNPMKTITKLVQGAPSLSQFDRNQVLAFLQEQGDYAPQSGQIVGILKQMGEEMAASIKESRADEANSAAGFEQLKAAKNQEVAAASGAIETKTARAGDLAVAKVTSANSLEDAQEELAETQKYLAQLKVSCEAQSKAWTARKAGRAEEVAAISEAIGVLNDDDALDIFKKTVPSAAALNQEGVGFLQARQGKANKIVRAQAILASTASIYKSQPLQLLAYSAKKALKSAAKHGQAPGGLGMMDGMIDNMVELLKKEGADDEKQKEWCDAELAKSADDKTAATEEGEMLDSSVEEITDAIKTAETDISTLSLEIQAMDGAVAQATVQRKQEAEEFTQSQALDQAAVALLEKATNRLNKFYNPVLYKEPEPTAAPEAAALVQIRMHKKAHAVPPPPPATFDAYAKKGEKSTGVLALMGMMMKDLKNDMKQAEYDEEDAQKEYEELMADSAETRAQNVKSITTKEASKATAEEKLAEEKKAKAINSQGLYNVNQVIADLHSSCDFILQNFDARKEARTTESESLKNAKAVLHGMK